MKSDRVITLDIGADGIKLAEFIHQDSGQLELVEYGLARFEVSPSLEMAQEAIVATMLKRLLDEKSFSSNCSTIIALDGHSIFSRWVKLPPVAADKLEQTIRHEAVQNIPFPINEVVWDYQLISKETNEPEVLLVAVKADLVDGMVHAVEAAGLFPERVDVVPAALANTVRFNYSDLTEAVLVVDVGTHASNLIFMDGGRTFFRTIPVAGNQLESILPEIERSISFYRSQQGGRAPERVLLAGDVDDCAELESLLAERLGLQIERLDPFRKVSLGSRVDRDVLVGMQHRLGALVGSAIRAFSPCGVEINLIPKSVLKERAFLRKQPIWVVCAAVVVLVFGVWAVGLSHMEKLMNEESEAVGIRIAELEPIENQLIVLEQRMAELESRGGMYREAVDRRTLWLESLLELRRLLPEGMFLLETKPIRNAGILEGIRVSGVSYLDKEPEGQDAVKLFRERLRSSKQFSERTREVTRPTKKLFARNYIIDVFFKASVNP